MELPKCPTCGQNITITEKPTTVPKRTNKNTIKYTRDVTTYLLSGDTMSVKDMIKKIPGSRWIREKRQWRVPINETSVRMLEEIIKYQEQQEDS